MRGLDLVLATWAASTALWAYALHAATGQHAELAQAKELGGEGSKGAVIVTGRHGTPVKIAWERHSGDSR